MDVTLIGFLLFGSLLLLLLIGIPVSFAMGGVSVILGFFFWGGLPSVDAFVLGTYTKISQSLLTALPLYIFMAAVLMYSDLADDLYEMVYRWFGGLRGGLAAGTTLIAAAFAAMIGLTSVTTATLGMVAGPSMLKRGYDEKLTIGVIMAGGNLGIIIPPSVVMIVYAAESGVSAGALFMAGIVPGILTALLFAAYAVILCMIRPEKGPDIAKEVRFTWQEKFNSLRAVLVPLAVILVVLGSIYLGVATPTEAGAVGAAGALVVAASRKKLTVDNIRKIFRMTARLNGLIFWILIGAVAYARIVSVTKVGPAVANLIVHADVDRWGILFLIMALFLFLGMFIDTIAVLLIMAPFFLPALGALNFDMVWFGILFIMAVCIGNLTPPFGLSIFVMKGVAPELSMRTIYAAVWPFVFLTLLALGAIMAFPQIALWLPNMMR